MLKVFGSRINTRQKPAITPIKARHYVSATSNKSHAVIDQCTHIHWRVTHRHSKFFIHFPVTQARNRRISLEVWAKSHDSSLPMPEALYNLKSNTHQPSFINTIYRGSLARACATEFVELVWHPWRFSSSPKGWWQDVAFLVRVGDPVGMTVALEYLSNLPPKRSLGKTERNRLARLGGVDKYLHSFMSQDQRTSLTGMHDLATPYPSGQQHRAILEAIVGISNSRNNYNIEALYSLTSNMLLQYAERLYHLYNKSPSAIVQTEYPEHAWKMWKFNSESMVWWNELSMPLQRGDPVAMAVVREYLLDVLGPQFCADPERLLAFKAPKLTRRELRRIGRLGMKLDQLLQFVFSDADNNSTKRHELYGVSNAMAELRTRMDEFVTRRGGSYEELYNLDTNAALEYGLGRISAFGDSVSLAVSLCYPEHAWHAWKFRQAPREWFIQVGVRFVADDCVAETVIREFVRSLAAKHSIQSADQWTRITREQLGSNTLRRLRLMGGGLRRIIKKLGLSSVNRHAWTSRRKKALSFSKLVRLLFPSEVVLEEVSPKALNFGWVECGLTYDELNRLRFDTVIPSLHLVIEFDGSHHRRDVFYSGEHSIQSHRDDRKRKLCELNGYSFVSVVYSEGNGENGSLSVETIRSAVVTVRPDLVPLLSETALC